MSRAFIDSNILVYAFSQDARKDRARQLLEEGCLTSVQSLNEFVNVAKRKLQFDWQEIHAGLDSIHTLCGSPLFLDLKLHRLGLAIAEQYRFAVYDAMIVAAALLGDCDTLYSEDMQHGQVIDGRVRIVNPFAPA